MRELSKTEILALSLNDMYLEFESIRLQVLGIPIYLEKDNEVVNKKIDWETREFLYNQVIHGINISIHISDLINGKFSEKWKNRTVYFGDYNNRKKSDYYNFYQEIINRKSIMINVINAYYNYKEKSYI